MLNWKLDDLSVFVAIIEQQGITTAARRMNLSKSAVSKTLSRLERDLGVRLIERNSRRIRATSEGQAFYQQGQSVIEQARQADALIAGLSAEPSGPLTVALPMAFSREIVAPRLNRFHSAFPGIKLEILVTSHPVDIIRDQIDIAVVVGPLENTELVAKTLYRGRLLPVASPDYAARLPEAGTIEDLVAHIHICESRYAIPRLEVLIDGQPTHINLAKIPIRVNDPVAVREAVVNGCGVSLLPNQYCRSAINAGKPVEVFGRVHFDAMASTLSAIYPGRRLLSNKTRAFLNFLEDICAEID